MSLLWAPSAEYLAPPRNGSSPFQFHFRLLAGFEFLIHTIFIQNLNNTKTEYINLKNMKTDYPGVVSIRENVRELPIHLLSPENVVERVVVHAKVYVGRNGCCRCGVLSREQGDQRGDPILQKRRDAEGRNYENTPISRRYCQSAEPVEGSSAEPML